MQSSIGHLFFSPPADHSKRWKNVSADYTHSYFYDDLFSGIKAEAEVMRRWLGTSSLKILDAAGGTGLLSEILIKLGHRVTLVDRSQTMLDLAQNRLETPERFEIVSSDLFCYRSERRFDVIFLKGNILNHLETEKRTVELIQQLICSLEPGARIYLDHLRKNYWEISDFWGEDHWWRCGNTPGMRIWCKTSLIDPMHFKLSHAVSRFGFKYVRQSTDLFLPSDEKWLELLRLAGATAIQEVEQWDGRTDSSECQTRVLCVEF